MAAALLMVVLLAAGCSQASGAAPISPRPAVTAGAPSPGALVATSSPSDLPLSAVNFSCRLPVVMRSGGGDAVDYSGAFVSFPAASYTVAAGGGIHSRYSTGDFITDAAPQLVGLPLGDPVFDVAKQRWLPAGSAQTTPDGAFYAYATIGASSTIPATIHLVDVARGVEKLLPFPVPPVGAPADIQVADFDSAGVYLVEGQFEQYPAGVWLLDPASGASRPLAQVHGVMAVRHGYAWVGRVDPRDPAPPTRPASGQLFNSIARVDLATGAETSWFYRSGASVALIGFAARDEPVVQISSVVDSLALGEIRIVATPGTPGSLVYGGGLWLGGPQADGDRLWFGNDRGLYLYTPQAGLRKVFAYNVDQHVAPAILPAGFCR